jgi:tetratricopeptide (TPR) repeat protein
MGRYEEARPWLLKALATRKDVMHVEDRQVGVIYLNLGHLDRLTFRFAEAEKNQRESLRVLEKLGPQHPLLGWPLSELGHILVEQKQYSQAIVTLERGLALPARKNPGKPEIKFPLGRALWESGIDPQRGATLIAQAEASYDPHNATDAKQLLEIHAWRNAHPHAVPR